MKVIIAAAGTGGHINPGLAIANKIKKEQPSSEIIFIGTDRGLENDLIPRSGYILKHIQAYGLSKNILKDLKTIKGIFQARKIIKEFIPDIVIGTGGYICGPVIMAAYIEKIPTMLHESNAFPGKAIKFLARYTKSVMISFEDAKKQIKNAERIVLTGTPTRISRNVIEIREKEEILNNNNLKNDKPLILIFGGSQGAKRINDAVIELLNSNKSLDYQVILSTGSKQYDYVINELSDKNIDVSDGVRIYPYIYNMEDIENACDVIVSRSGATTVAEIALMGKPAIFIPLPNVSNDHQTYNAKVLEEAGAAKIIKDQELNGEILDKNIRLMIQDKISLKKMGENAKKFAITDSEDRIYNEIIKILE